MIEIKDKSLCSGCSACKNICPKNAIEMIEDECGFKYPKINRELCINCGLCNKVCPILNKKIGENNPKCYACYNKDEKTRMNSSSGGIFSLLATEILNRNGVVFGAAFNNDFSLTHQYIEKIEDLDKLRTSKYLQSNIGDSYKQVKKFLNSDRYVLFTGTPCQIEGLISYLGKNYDKLYTQDIICHGVPSPKVWKKYLEYREKIDKEKPKKINFRDKKQEGWKMFSLSFKYKEKEYSKNQKQDLYMKAFLKDVCLRNSCYNCSFRKKQRLSDITLADYWGIEKIHPELDDNKGTSLVLVNSNKGKKLYSAINRLIISKEVTIEDAIRSNKALIKSPNLNKNRNKFFKNLDKKEFDILVKKYVPKASVTKKIQNKTKRILKSLLKKLHLPK